MTEQKIAQSDKTTKARREIALAEISESLMKLQELREAIVEEYGAPEAERAQGFMSLIEHVQELEHQIGRSLVFTGEIGIDPADLAAEDVEVVPQ